ncbi:kinesin-like protein KIN-12C [Prosopis cineraria]|uniref:kinesin-like protein KIN-12C n=1 Tax=Prosopis cineraria TaxID=364024 RepID=UPI00240FC6E1|nr:kinesin-like protein KIN-12C [Prosopis cineraria]
MFKESSTRTLGRNTSRNPQFEANENEFEASQNKYNYPPPRTPLNTIPDPWQCQKEPEESDANSHYKLEARSGRSSDKRCEASSDRFGNLSLNYGTPRFLGRNGKANSEPNSAQSTPARNASRISLGGAGGICPGTRVQYPGGGKAGSSGTFFKGVSVANSEFSEEVQHFELKEDPSFWMDHNVQVLIRIRPLNNIEKFSQGHGRCLRQETAQTLVWVGHPETRFTFDHIACETLSQENLFRVAGMPMVENCLSGYNSCMFAYGQTGSGKTYTMMGEIKEEEGHLTEKSGITPRVFDFLFMRIKLEEESRRDDKLRYSCKCSFLEIYNEQITDLLEPSSTNLQLREDTKKGVYVENLSEYSVGTVSDVLKLVLQGTANRKVAATHMNCKSSRSHSVFTCIIESRWEKDSMTHFRFARLNLVDLAGSERQKSSGTDSERLKEAANINKSLSTLGLVIMNLVDLTHGKPRHVPYRDSRLTFLLQDSLGGNSKTVMIANVSPSICSANETLSTLKFAQRAKLVQNNVKVNEGTSGDINALQWQIQQLKSQLSFLIKHKNFRSLTSNLEPYPELHRLSELSEGCNSFMEKATMGHKLCLQTKEMTCMKATLLGALRREKLAEIAIQNLNAEIERLNRLARQREEDTQHTAFKLRFCEEKIDQLELLVDGALSPEEHLSKENRALKKEIKELQARIENNTETTRLALENDRILHQLRQFQDFYEHGERERLLTELSQLRDHLVVSLQEKLTFSMRNESQDNDTKQELEDCQIMNSKLLRDVDRLQTELVKYISCDQAKSDSVLNSSFELPNELMKTDKCSLVGTVSLKSDFGNEMAFNTWTVDDVEGHALGASEMLTNNNEENRQKMLEAKLERMSKDLEEVKLLNDQYQEKWALQLSQKHQIESVCDEVEMETTRTILHLQEEIANLQSDLEGRLCSTARENTELRNMVATKEEEIRTLCLEWERAIFELTTFLLDGSRSLRDACGQVESITGSFPEGNARIAEHIGMAVKSHMEKEETIQKLERSLEEAQKMVLDMELKVSSLKEATATLSAFQQLHNEDSVQLRVSLDEKADMLRFLENEVKCKDEQLRKADKRADAAFLLVRWLSDNQNIFHTNDLAGDISIPEQDVHSKLGSQTIFEEQGDRNHLISNELMAQVELTKTEVLEMNAAAEAFCEDREMHMADFQTSAFSLSPASRDFVLDPVKQNQDTRIKIKDLNMHNNSSACCAADTLIADTNKFLKLEDWPHILHQIQRELVDMNIKLSIIQNYTSTEMDLSNCSLIDNDLMDFDASSADSSSVSDSSTETESIVSGSILRGSRSKCGIKFPGKITEQIANPKSEIQADNQESENTDHHVKISIQSKAAASFLRKELYATYKAFNEQNVHFSELLKELDDGSCSCIKEQRKETPCELMIQKVEAGNQNDPKILVDMTARLDDGLTKFEQAHATVKEADFMLHALTKAYEDAKQLSVTWKQANENLMTERASLTDEIQKLKSSICRKEEENQLLKDHINSSLTEMANSVSILEECFLQVQTDVEKKFVSIFSNVLQTQGEMIFSTKGLRTSLEDIISWAMEERFVSFVLKNCYITELVSKFPFFRVKHNFRSTKEEKLCKFLEVCPSAESVMATSNEGSGKRDQAGQILQEEQDLPNSNLMYEHMALKKELERKQELLEGLFFDFRLLQELASNGKDIKEETEKLITSLSQVRYELEIKTNHLEDTLVQNRKLEGSLAETERILSTSNHELKLAQELIGKLSDQNTELREILKELYAKKAEAEEQLNEQKDVIKGLEKEIVNLTSSLENNSLSLLEGIEDELRKAIIERDQLHEEVSVLNDKLEMAYSLADEKEAIAIEARQKSEASKLYAEQKEEEVKILEHSVEELEGTINVLEKKVYEMDEEVGRHHLIRDSLEKKLQALEERLQAVDSLPQNADSDIIKVQQPEEQMSRQPSRRITELHEALNRIRILEEEKAEQDKQIKQWKEYISEVVLHAEAQASQHQQKYKTLESMFREVKKEMSNLTSTAPLEKVEKSSMRARGSSSPFRCISNLVQQMNQEKDQELSVANLRVEELEALAASRQKEVCLLQTRLAATESMTHDVIRDLLGVKMDLTNYATLVDQNQILKLVEEAHNLRVELFAKEKEIQDQSLLINELIEERESCKLVMRSKDADIIASQIALQRLQERDQLLSAQREMLKMDKTSLMKKVAELDDMVKTLSATRDNQLVQHSSKIKDRSSQKLDSAGITRRLSQCERLLSRENDKLVQYCKSSAANNPHR